MMDRVMKQVLARRHLDEAPPAHHRDPVGDIIDHRQIVRNKQICQAERFLHVLEQVQDLRLDRDVESGDRLVANQQIRFQRQRPREPDPLALTAGETMRVTVQEPGV